MNCKRCYYLDAKLGVAQPPGYPFALNSAVDYLLKKEFDSHRKAKTAHPLMTHYGLKAVPLDHELMDEWRDALRRGIRYLDKETNFMITGGIDDVWVNDEGEFIIVDYKATSKAEEVNLDADWQIGYKRQVEIYQWLFRQNGFKVNDTAYFVYCNGLTDKDAFDGKLEFDIKLLPYKGDDSWVGEVLPEIKKLLDGDTVPDYNDDCDYCLYRKCAFKEEMSASHIIADKKTGQMGFGFRG